MTQQCHHEIVATLSNSREEGELQVAYHIQSWKLATYIESHKKRYLSKPKRLEGNHCREWYLSQSGKQ